MVKDLEGWGYNGLLAPGTDGGGGGGSSWLTRVHSVMLGPAIIGVMQCFNDKFIQMV